MEIDAGIRPLYRIVTNATLAVLATDYRHSSWRISMSGWTL